MRSATPGQTQLKVEHRFPDTTARIGHAAKRLEVQLGKNPFHVVNEAEFQAMLHAELLQEFPEEVALSLAPGVIDRRPGQPLKGRRVYREAKIRPGQAGQEPDLIILHDAAQTILPKENHAPSRFVCPYAAIIETKIDATPADILSGKPGRSLAASVIDSDLRKWLVPSETGLVLSIIYTANPDWYAGWPNVVTVRRVIAPAPARLPSAATIKAATGAVGRGIDTIHAAFRAKPFRYLREKDFEAELFNVLRAASAVSPDELHPVRSQWMSAHSETLGRRRKHDLVVLGAVPGALDLEVELKTSHSDQHNWFRNKELVREFGAMQTLREAGVLDRALFLMFRFGPLKWQGDAASLCATYPAVEFDYRCSED